MRRLITEAKVTCVALCKRGVNNLSTLYKSTDGALVQAVVKSGTTFDEKGELLAVVAAPDHEDDDGDIFDSPAAVQASAHHFMREGSVLDMEHDGKPLGKSDAFVAESFIIQKSDPRFADWKSYSGEAVDVTGGWGMVIQIDNPELRKSYRRGEWDGVSLFARGAKLKVLEKSQSLRDDIKAALLEAGLTKANDQGEIDMTPEELTAALAKNNETLATSIVDGLAKALKPEAAKPPEKGSEEGDSVKFVGDPLNPDDLKKHQAKITTAALMKSGDLDDPIKLAEHLEAIEKAAKNKGDDVDPELAKARQRVKDLEKSSNQGAGGDKTPAKSGHVLIKSGIVDDTDETAELLKAASSAANELNNRRSTSLFSGLMTQASK